jgi:hypothetical protein
MTISGTDQIQSLVKTRRLLLLANQVEKKRLEPNPETPSFKEIMEGAEPKQSGTPEVKPPIQQARMKFDQPAENSAIDKLT